VLPVGGRKKKGHKQQERPTNRQALKERHHRGNCPGNYHEKHADLALPPNLDSGRANYRAGKDIHRNERESVAGRNSRDADRQGGEDRKDSNDPAER
jgi:hypothetical protein